MKTLIPACAHPFLTLAFFSHKARAAIMITHFSTILRRVSLPVAILLCLAGVPGGWAGIIIVGGGDHSAVRVFDSSTGSLLRDFQAFSPGFAGGVTVAGGDVNGDGAPDIIVGTGSGGGQVSVFNGVTGGILTSFFPFAPGHTAGVTVASGDVNNDGIADIIVGSGAGSLSRVNVYSGSTFTLLNSISPFAPEFLGGVTVAASDLNNDGFAEIVVGAGSGAAPVVQVYHGQTPTLLSSFLAFAPAFSGGVFVGAAAGEIVVGSGPGQAVVGTFEGLSGLPINAFPAYPGFTGGISVGAADLDGDGLAEILTAPGAGAGSLIKLFDGKTGNERLSFFAFDPAFLGGVNVALVAIPESPMAAILIGGAALAFGFFRRGK